MLNVPDYVLEEEETIRMDNKVSVDEEGELRCSDFEVPQFTSETFIDLFLLHLEMLTQEQWDFLAFGKIDLPTVLILTNLCNDIVENVTMEVLEEIEPQCNSANTPVTTNNSELPQRERNLCSVTREDIETSLGDSLNQCFAKVMNVSEKKSEYSEQLRRLVAGEVARNINCRLAVQSTSSKQTEEFVRIETPLANEMVRNISKIFTQNLLRKNSSETSEEEEEYLDSDFSHSSYRDDITTLSSEYSDLSSSLLPMPPTSIREKFSKGEKTFLAVLLAKVLDHVTESTKISILALDFDGILHNLIETVEEASFPATCGNLHLSMYDNLCKDFGSAKLLQAAIMSEDLAFAEAFARELKTQLEKTSRKSPSFLTKLKRLTEYTREYKIEKTMLNVPDYLLEEDETIRMDNKWDFLAFGKIDLPTVLILTNLCDDIVENVTMEVLEEVEPQCNSANTPVTTNNSKLPQRERNLCSVTREDIEASLGDSLNQCFAEVMNVSEKKSEYSEQLRRLVAGEVARKINCRLAVQSTSSKQTEEFFRD
ncbi:hypothetical protein D9C73_023559 [Collichthys lucidus]|uniref:Uncharacterized protein n=1 Tax=Collichthys lucidus TaxID=240159 RepID=A0A4U5VLW5_COLLU|nr:hypothetical protein D9C73_023559 [Collichthys lucidus]